MANVVNWFDIPAKNFDRACKFYGKVLGGDVHGIDTPMGLKMGFLPGTSPDGVGGAVVSGPGYEPSEKGSLVYLNGGEDLSVPLGRVEEAGGKVLMPKTAIGENGFMAHFRDSEGNRVALHSIAMDRLEDPKRRLPTLVIRELGRGYYFLTGKNPARMVEMISAWVLERNAGTARKPAGVTMSTAREA